MDTFEVGLHEGVGDGLAAVKTRDIGTGTVFFWRIKSTAIEPFVSQDGVGRNVAIETRGNRRSRRIKTLALMVWHRVMVSVIKKIEEAGFAESLASRQIGPR